MKCQRSNRFRETTNANCRSVWRMESSSQDARRRAREADSFEDLSSPKHEIHGTADRMASMVIRHEVHGPGAALTD